MKKRIIKRVVFLVICVIVAMFVYINIFAPVTVTEKRVIIDSETLLDSAESLQYTIDATNRGECEGSGGQVVRTSDIPSNDVNDYCYIILRLKVKNYSFFKQHDFDAIVTSTSDDSRIIYKDALVESYWLDSFAEDDACPVWGYFYRGDMTDEQVVEYLSKQKIRLVFSNQIKQNVYMDVSLDGLVQVYSTHSEKEKK